MTGFDIVLRGGRVIDPESGLDAVRDVAIAGDRVARVGTALAPGRRDIDVTGQVVTAGFIDLHSHAYDTGGQRLQAMDGVTTALELEAGVAPVRTAYDSAAARGGVVNYGFATSWGLARMSVLAGTRLDASVQAFFANMAGRDWQRAATPAEVQRILARLETDIADGAPLMHLAARTSLAAVKYPMTLASKMSALANDPGAMKVFLSDRTSAANRVSIRFLDTYMNYQPAVEPEDFDACPVLLTQPAQDRWSPHYLSVPVLDRITKVPVDTVMLDNAGHYPLEEPGLEQMQEAIAGFATKHAT